MDQVVNHMWDGHNKSFDLVVLFTGNMNFKDGDGKDKYIYRAK